MAALQTYHGPLLFTPSTTALGQCFHLKESEVAEWAICGGDTVWSPSLAVLSGHTSDIMQVAFSPDGTVIASASVHGTTRLWNGHTGAALAVLASHGIRPTFLQMAQCLQPPGIIQFNSGMAVPVPH